MVAPENADLPNAPSPPLGEGRPKILVIDDNNLARTVLLRQLTEAGYQTFGASDGPKGLQILVEERIDAVVLDVVMDTMNGLEVLRRIRGVRSPGQLPILMISASKDHDTVMQSVQAGANDFLSRPTPVAVLDAKIRRHIALSREAQEESLGLALSNDADILHRQIGPFKIKSLLGEGQASRVVQAWDQNHSRPVVIKALRSDRLREGGHRHFRREALALAAVQHPSVAAVHEVRGGRIPFLVSAFLDGIPLAAELKSLRRPALKSILKWTLEALAGLEAIHTQGIVHGDLKPANLILTPDNSITLVDLGVNHLSAVQTKSGNILLGSPGWMAPEQAKGSQVGTERRSDLFSLSSILYVLLTGAHPFPAENVTQQLFSIINREPTPPREISSKIPLQLEQICLKGLQKELDKRFQSAAEFSSALREVQGDLEKLDTMAPI